MPRLATLAAILALPLLAQDNPAAKVDAIFEPWNNATGPGAAVAVIHHGRLVLEKGYGLANLEYAIPIRPDSVFHVASVSKQFTAMAMVLLERDGKLSIDDEIHKYLPELPAYPRPITIRNILQHTSGIRDQWQTLALAGWSLEDVITQDQILRLLFRQKSLNFAPGGEHLYSNAGFTLAAEIVARVSGKTFPEFCATRIFQPLGMANTHFHQDHHRIVKNRAYSYSGSAGAFEAAPLNFANAGATSLFTTPTDLTKWLDNFRDPKVGGKAAIDRLREQAVLNSGKKIDYALGVSVGQVRGLPAVSHTGSDAGYRAYVAWFPDQEFGVAVAANVAGFNAQQAGNRVAAVYLGSLMTAPEAAPPAPYAAKPEIAAPSGLAAYAGAYWSEELETRYTVSVDGGKLIATHAHHGVIELRPTGPDAFRANRWFMPEVKFSRAANGTVTAVSFGGNRVRGVRVVKE